MEHNDPNLTLLAVCVKIVFVDQKNGERFDTRSQRQTKDPVLCPVLRVIRAVICVRSHFPRYSNNIPLCATFKAGNWSSTVNQTYTLNLLKRVCKDFGDRSKFGFSSNEIGNKSIQSGAAMALFLKGHSSDKIMLLGRWKSSSWLDYIQPQVLEQGEQERF